MKEGKASRDTSERIVVGIGTPRGLEIAAIGNNNIWSK